MRRILATAAIAAAIALVLPAAQTRTLRVTSETADIHIEPHKSSSVIGQVKLGDILQVFDTAGEQRGWFYVSFYSKEKWATITGFIESQGVEMVVEKTEPEVAEQSEVAAEAARPAPKPPAAKTKVATKRPAPKKTSVNEAVPPQKAVTPESPGTAPLLDFEGRVRVTSEGGTIRAADSDTARVVRKVDPGEEMVATARKGAWFRVKYPRRDGIVLIGFIHDKEVVAVEPSKTEPEQAGPPAKAPPLPDKPEKAAPPEEPPELMGPAGSETPSGGLMSLFRGWRAGVRLGAGYAAPSPSSYGSGMAFGAALYLQFSDYLGVEISGMSFKSECDGGAEGMSPGELSRFPLSLSIFGRYPLRDRVAPYVLAGVGYSRHSFSLDQDLVENWNELGFDLDERMDDAFLFQVGAGVDYRVIRDIFLSVDVRYLKTVSQGSWTLSDSFTGLESTGDLSDINLDTLMVSVGIKIFVNLF